MAEDRILTMRARMHPLGKKGVRISKAKYDKVKSVLIKCLKDKELTHSELTECANKRLEGKFQGSINWYVETVKLDLEARKIVERVKEAKPQVYKLK